MSPDSSSAWRFGATTFNAATGVLEHDGHSSRLRPKTADLLAELLAHAGTVRGKEQLIESVWRDVAVSDNTLTQSIQEIRRALGDDARAPRFVETIPKRGYRWVGPPIKAIGTSTDTEETSRSPRLAARIATVVVLAVIALIWWWLGLRPPSAAQHAYDAGTLALGQTGTVLAKTHFQRALDHDPNFDAARIGLAQVAYFEGEWSTAKDLLGSIDSGDAELNMRVHGLAGEIAYLEGKLDDAMVRLERALSHAERLDAAPMIVRTHRVLDEVRQTAGLSPLPALEVTTSDVDDPELSAMSAFYDSEDLTRLREALARYQDLGDTANQAITRLAMAQSGLLDPPTEHDMLRRSATMFFELGNRPMTALVHNRLARHYLVDDLDQDNLDQALAEVEQALAIHVDMGARLNAARDRRLRGTILYARALAGATSDWLSAEQDLEKAAAAFESMGCPAELGLTRLIAGSLALDQDRVDAARSRFEDAKTSLADSDLAVFAELGSVRVLMKEQRWADALDRAMALPSSDNRLVAETRARCLMRLGRHDDALMQLANHDGPLRNAMQSGNSPPPPASLLLDFLRR
ncbi:MAG: winged helix-turn-helix domain-containing protein [Acidobacteriota bacterium]